MLQDFEQVEMRPEVLDDGSCVVNFDVYEVDGEEQPVKQGGYVMVRQEDDDACFTVTVFNANGDVVSEVHLPFDFKEL
jgi:hypothetical protein